MALLSAKALLKDTPVKPTTAHSCSGLHETSLALFVIHPCVLLWKGVVYLGQTVEKRNHDTRY